MSGYSQVRLAIQKTALDRDTWADLVKAPHSLLARGVGEHLMVEPLFFGEAFEEPPLMTYSVIEERAADFPTIVAHNVAKPTAKVRAATPYFGTEATQGEYNNRIADGSFEIAGRHGAEGNVPSILTPNDLASYTDFQYLPGAAADAHYTFWMQTNDAGAKWKIVKGKATQGDYSATVTLDNPVSRWLYPIDFYEYVNNGSIFGQSYPYTEDGLYGWEVEEWGREIPWVNPNNGTNTIRAKVFATAACSLEYTGYVAGHNAWAYEKFGYGPTLPWHDLVPVYNNGSVPVDAGRWNDISWTFPIPYLEAGTDNLIVKQSMRVAGTPGTQIWIDDVYVDSNLHTTHDLVFTVGVAEWVQDEQGFYVGAKLWIKSGSPVGYD